MTMVRNSAETWALGLGEAGGLPGELGQHPAQLPAERRVREEGLGAGLDPVGIDPLAVVDAFLVAERRCSGSGRGRCGGQHHEQQRGDGRSAGPERCHDALPWRGGLLTPLFA
jgi:hypothetical protein